MGGCRVFAGMPEWRCGGCGHEWGRSRAGGVNPPPVLGDARVLVFASGARQLAIGESLETREIRLIHCDDDWSVTSSTTHATVDAARAQAEMEWPGVSEHWTDAGVSREEAVAWLEDESAEFKCSFCGRRPDQVKNLLAQGDARICNFCIVDFAKKLAKERES